MVRPEHAASALLAQEGWIVDPLTVARLERKLAAIDPDVVGLVAPLAPLPPGSSYRVHAEQLALADGRHEPAGDASSGGVADTPAVEGAVVLRPGIPTEAVEVDRDLREGRLRVEPTGHTHDPWAPPQPVEPASPLGRSPFPRRPVVVFLEVEPDVELDLADWARTMVNGLVRLDVEGRLARTTVPAGLHLTRTCAPTEESVHALRPDVIVTLDDAARELAPRWCTGMRSVVLVDFHLDPTVDVELVPWRIDRNAGRVRARIGQAVDVATLARLVNRLCAGPQPVPPDKHAVDLNATPLPVPTRRSGAERVPTVAVVHGASGPDELRLSGFVEHVRTSGAIGALVDVDAALARDDDVVVIDASVPTAIAQPLTDARAENGRVTVVDIGAGEATAERVALAARAGFALVQRGADAGALAPGTRVQVLPVVVPPARVAALATARIPPDEVQPVVAVAGRGEAVDRWLQDHTDLRVVHVERHDEVPPEARAVVVPATSEDRTADVVEAALLGIPTVYPLSAAPELADPVISQWSVDEQDGDAAWRAALHDAVYETPAGTRAQLVRRSEALYGSKGASARVARVVTWALHHGER